MQVSPISNNQQKSPSFNAKLSKETTNMLQEIVYQSNGQKGLKRLSKKIAKLNLIGNTNTEIEIYENSKRTFITSPTSEICLTTKDLEERFIGTYMSVKNKLFGNNSQIETKISDNILELNLDIFNKINESDIESAEYVLGVPKAVHKGNQSIFDKIVKYLH